MLRSIRSQAPAVFVCVVAIAAATGVGFGSESWTWRDVAAETPIDHAVMVRGPFDDAHRKVRLAGPVAVTVSDEDAGPCFAVYTLKAQRDEPQRTAQVGGGGMHLRLGPPVFLLVPARRLRNGEPAAKPPRGVYEIRPVLDPPAVLDAEPSAAGPPAYIGLPVDYRHHYERVPAGAADHGLVVFAARDLPSGAAPVAVADDFGIARLAARDTGRAATWLPVRPVQDGGQP